METMVLNNDAYQNIVNNTLFIQGLLRSGGGKQKYFECGLFVDVSFGFYMIEEA